MKKKNLLHLTIVIILCLAVGIYLVNRPEDGKTMESRSKMIESDIGAEWMIVEERNIEGCIVSGITCGQEDGIAVFKPEENGTYRYQGATFVETGNVVKEVFFADDKTVDVFWINRKDLDSAEIGVAINGKNPTIHKYDLAKSALIYISVDAGYYVLDATYYDKDGNVV